MQAQVSAQHSKAKTKHSPPHHLAVCQAIGTQAQVGTQRLQHSQALLQLQVVMAR